MGFLTAIARSWMGQQIYGWRFAPNISTFDFPYMYAKTLLYASTECRPEQREHVKALCEVLMPSCDADLMQFIENYEKVETGENQLGALLGGSAIQNAIFSRVMLYDCISCSVADGVYSPEEQAHVHQIAKRLGVSKNVVSCIETICMEELSVNDRKSMLLSSYIHPTPKEILERSRTMSSNMEPLIPDSEGPDVEPYMAPGHFHDESKIDGDRPWE